jgi:CIC family chloride channel protein
MGVTPASWSCPKRTFRNSPEETDIRAILQNSDRVLLPTMTIDGDGGVRRRRGRGAGGGGREGGTRHVIGILTEAHALKRYSEESELRRRELLGEM